MKALTTLQKFANCMGLILDAHQATSKKVILSYLANIYGFIVLGIFVLGSGAAAILAFPDKIDEFTYALAEIVISGSLLFAYMDFARHKCTIMCLVSEIQELTNQSKKS